MKRENIFPFVILMSFAVTAKCHLALGQKTPDNSPADTTTAASDRDILTTELTKFLSTTSESLENESLERMIKLQPTFNDLATAPPRAFQNGRASGLTSGISQAMCFM